MQLFLVYCIILVYCVILVVNITDIAIIKLYDVDRKRHESPEKGSGIGKSRPAGTGIVYNNKYYIIVIRII